MQDSTPYRISILEASFMLFLTALIDGFQIIADNMLALSAIPFLGLIAAPLGVSMVVIGWVLSLLAFILYAIWFAVRKVPFLSFGGDDIGSMISSALRGIAVLFGMVGEFTPLVNGFPFLSIVVGHTIFSSRKEDRARAKRTS